MDYLGANETALDVRVNDSGGFESCGSSFDGPGPAFIFADGEERDESQKLIGDSNETVQPGLLQTIIVQKQTGIFTGELHQFGFDLAANSRGGHVGLGRNVLQLKVGNNLINLGSVAIGEV